MQERVQGQEQPHIPAGMFRIRVPFVHYRLSVPDALIGLFVSFIYFIPVSLYQSLFDLPLEQAWALIHFSLWLLLLHNHFGDYAMGGWITASLPLVMAYLGDLPAGPERIHGLMAIHFWLAVFMLGLGITGFAKKAVEYMPQTLKAGILLGAGMAGFWTLLSPLSTANQTVQNYPIGIGVAGILAITLIWSYPLLIKRKTSPLLNRIAMFGLPLGFALGGILGTIAGEIPPPEIESMIVPADWSVIATFSVFGVGFPPASILFGVLPLSLLIYVIAYGDFVFIETMVVANNKRRPDEKVNINSSRAHIIVGIRNVAHMIFGPHPILAGPAFTAYSAIHIIRWGQGKDQVDSIFDATGSSTLFLILGSYVGLIAFGAAQMTGIALGLALVMQGFVCSYVGMKMVKYTQQAGIALLMGMIIATRGAAWGLGIGILLYFLMEFRLKKSERLEEVEPELLMEPEEKAGMERAWEKREEALEHPTDG